ncbi:hypothetical protein SNEBB_011166 [Seison nebaliae]|nr:hypothetical protein SNEBB_011166 [Seison nebaliae]
MNEGDERDLNHSSKSKDEQEREENEEGITPNKIARLEIKSIDSSENNNNLSKVFSVPFARSTVEVGPSVGGAKELKMDKDAEMLRAINSGISQLIEILLKITPTHILRESVRDKADENDYYDYEEYDDEEEDDEEDEDNIEDDVEEEEDDYIHEEEEDIVHPDDDMDDEICGSEDFHKLLAQHFTAEEDLIGEEIEEGEYSTSTEGEGGTLSLTLEEQEKKQYHSIAITNVPKSEPKSMTTTSQVEELVVTQPSKHSTNGPTSNLSNLVKKFKEFKESKISGKPKESTENKKEKTKDDGKNEKRTAGYWQNRKLDILKNSKNLRTEYVLMDGRAPRRVLEFAKPKMKCKSPAKLSKINEKFVFSRTDRDQALGELSGIVLMGDEESLQGLPCDLLMCTLRYYMNFDIDTDAEHYRDALRLKKGQQKEKKDDGKDTTSTDGEDIHTQLIVDMLALYPEKTIDEIHRICSLNGNSNEIATSLQVRAVTCLVNVLEAYPRSMSFIHMIIKDLVVKLDHPDAYLNEQIISILDASSKKYGEQILRTNGVINCLKYLDFYHLATQKKGFNLIANCVLKIRRIEDYPYVRNCIPILVQRLINLINQATAIHLEYENNFPTDKLEKFEMKRINCAEELMDTPRALSENDYLTNLDHIIQTICTMIVRFYFFYQFGKNEKEKNDREKIVLEILNVRKIENDGKISYNNNVVHLLFKLLTMKQLNKFETNQSTNNFIQQKSFTNIIYTLRVIMEFASSIDDSSLLNDIIFGITSMDSDESSTLNMREYSIYDIILRLLIQDFDRSFNPLNINFQSMDIDNKFDRNEFHKNYLPNLCERSNRMKSTEELSSEDLNMISDLLETLLPPLSFTNGKTNGVYTSIITRGIEQFSNKFNVDLLYSINTNTIDENGDEKMEECNDNKTPSEIIDSFINQQTTTGRGRDLKKYVKLSQFHSNLDKVDFNTLPIELFEKYNNDLMKVINHLTNDETTKIFSINRWLTFFQMNTYHVNQKSIFDILKLLFAEIKRMDEERKENYSKLLKLTGVSEGVKEDQSNNLDKIRWFVKIDEEWIEVNRETTDFFEKFYLGTIEKSSLIPMDQLKLINDEPFAPNDLSIPNVDQKSLLLSGKSMTKPFELKRELIDDKMSIRESSMEEESCRSDEKYHHLKMMKKDVLERWMKRTLSNNVDIRMKLINRDHPFFLRFLYLLFPHFYRLLICCNENGRNLKSSQNEIGVMDSIVKLKGDVMKEMKLYNLVSSGGLPGPASKRLWRLLPHYMNGNNLDVKMTKTSLQLKALRILIRIITMLPVEHVKCLLANHDICTDLVYLLSSTKDQKQLDGKLELHIVTLQLAKVLLQKLPYMFLIQFHREGFLHKLKELYETKLSLIFYIDSELSTVDSNHRSYVRRSLDDLLKSFHEFQPFDEFNDKLSLFSVFNQNGLFRETWESANICRELVFIAKHICHWQLYQIKDIHRLFVNLQSMMMDNSNTSYDVLTDIIRLSNSMNDSHKKIMDNDWQFTLVNLEMKTYKFKDTDDRRIQINESIVKNTEEIRKNFHEFAKILNETKLSMFEMQQSNIIPILLNILTEPDIIMKSRLISIYELYLQSLLFQEKAQEFNETPSDLMKTIFHNFYKKIGIGKSKLFSRLCSLYNQCIEMISSRQKLKSENDQKFEDVLQFLGFEESMEIIEFLNKNEYESLIEKQNMLKPLIIEEFFDILQHYPNAYKCLIDMLHDVLQRNPIHNYCGKSLTKEQELQNRYLLINQKFPSSSRSGLHRTPHPFGDRGKMSGKDKRFEKRRSLILNEQKIKDFPSTTVLIKNDGNLTTINELLKGKQKINEDQLVVLELHEMKEIEEDSTMKNIDSQLYSCNHGEEMQSILLLIDINCRLEHLHRYIGKTYNLSMEQNQFNKKVKGKGNSKSQGNHLSPNKFQMLFRAGLRPSTSQNVQPSTLCRYPIWYYNPCDLINSVDLFQLTDSSRPHSIHEILVRMSVIRPSFLSPTVASQLRQTSIDNPTKNISTTTSHTFHEFLQTAPPTSNNTATTTVASTTTTESYPLDVLMGPLPKTMTNDVTSNLIGMNSRFDNLFGSESGSSESSGSSSSYHKRQTKSGIIQMLTNQRPTKSRPNRYSRNRGYEYKSRFSTESFDGKNRNLRLILYVITAGDRCYLSKKTTSSSTGHSKRAKANGDIIKLKAIPDDDIQRNCSEKNENLLRTIHEMKHYSQEKLRQINPLHYFINDTNVSSIPMTHLYSTSLTTDRQQIILYKEEYFKLFVRRFFETCSCIVNLVNKKEQWWEMNRNSFKDYRYATTDYNDKKYYKHFRSSSMEFISREFVYSLHLLHLLEELYKNYINRTNKNNNNSKYSTPAPYINQCLYQVLSQEIRKKKYVGCGERINEYGYSLEFVSRQYIKKLYNENREKISPWIVELSLRHSSLIPFALRQAICYLSVLDNGRRAVWHHLVISSNQHTHLLDHERMNDTVPIEMSSVASLHSANTMIEKKRETFDRKDDVLTQTYIILKMFTNDRGSIKFGERKNTKYPKYHQLLKKDEMEIDIEQSNFNEKLKLFGKKCVEMKLNCLNKKSTERTDLMEFNNLMRYEYYSSNQLIKRSTGDMMTVPKSDESKLTPISSKLLAEGLFEAMVPSSELPKKPNFNNIMKTVFEWKKLNLKLKSSIPHKTEITTTTTTTTSVPTTTTIPSTTTTILATKTTTTKTPSAANAALATFCNFFEGDPMAISTTSSSSPSSTTTTTTTTTTSSSSSSSSSSSTTTTTTTESNRIIRARMNYPSSHPTTLISSFSHSGSAANVPSLHRSTLEGRRSRLRDYATFDQLRDLITLPEIISSADISELFSGENNFMIPQRYKRSALSRKYQSYQGRNYECLQSEKVPYSFNQLTKCDFISDKIVSREDNNRQEILMNNFRTATNCVMRQFYELLELSNDPTNLITTNQKPSTPNFDLYYDQTGEYSQNYYGINIVPEIEVFVQAMINSIWKEKKMKKRTMDRRTTRSATDVTNVPDRSKNKPPVHKQSSSDDKLVENLQRNPNDIHSNVDMFSGIEITSKLEGALLHVPLPSRYHEQNDINNYLVNDFTCPDQRQLEVQFAEEVGTGLGPTLEFYSIVSQEFQRSSLAMWQCHQKLSVQSLCDPNNFIDVIHNHNGLYPKPYDFSILFNPISYQNRHDITISDMLYQRKKLLRILMNFRLLGMFMAKSLIDFRNIDIEFCTTFFKWLRYEESTITVDDINEICDPAVVSTIRYLDDLNKQMLVIKHALDESIVVGNGKLVMEYKTELELLEQSVEDLGMDFNVPGMNGVEEIRLLPEDNNKIIPSRLTANNLEKFIKLLSDWYLLKGVYYQMLSFRTGFEEIFSLRHLRYFLPKEMNLLFGGDRSMNWTETYVANCCVCQHGYKKNSQPIKWLIRFLCEMDERERKNFVLFVTGSPRLPIGGLAALNPRLTIVRKSISSEGIQGNKTLNDYIDDHLPSVMTCTNYLKLPAYSSYSVLEKQLRYAINNRSAFHMS